MLLRSVWSSIKESNNYKCKTKWSKDKWKWEESNLLKCVQICSPQQDKSSWIPDLQLLFEIKVKICIEDAEYKIDLFFNLFSEIKVLFYHLKSNYTLFIFLKKVSFFLINCNFLHSKLLRINFSGWKNDNKKSFWFSNIFYWKSLIFFKNSSFDQGKNFNFRTIFTYYSSNNSLRSDFNSTLLIKIMKLLFFFPFTSET